MRAMEISNNPVVQALQETVRSAAAQRRTLRLRGGGSKDFYGQRLDGEIVDTRTLAGVQSYEPSELVVTVGAGESLSALETLLAAQNQYLAFEPPHYRWSDAAGSAATVGGMVASGLSGPSRASLGCVRDHVLGVVLINGRGELLRFGGQVIKNVAGYDLSRLMVGALGTLGVLVEVSLKVLPLPPAEATLCFALSQADALSAMNRWRGQPLPLNASCWVRDQGRELLFLRLRGAVAAVEAACTRLLHEAPSSARAERLESQKAAADWLDCRDQRLPFFQRPSQPGLALWRLSVAPSAPVLDLPGEVLIEWHGGLRWLWAPLSAAPQLRAVAAKAGGHATVFVAEKSELATSNGHFDTYTPLSEPLAAIHRQLKAEFDPQGIFNPGRLYPSL